MSDPSIVSEEKYGPTHYEHEKAAYTGTSDVVAQEVREHVSKAAQEELGAGGSVWATFKRNPRAFSVLCVVMMTSIINGIELSMSGSMLGSQAFCKVMGDYDPVSQSYVVAAGHVSSWTAAACPGQFFGIYLASIIGDHYGRKYVLQGSMVVVFIGAIIELVAADWKVWLVSKLVMGIATGTIQASASTFIAETSPRELRGGALIGYQLFNNVGNLFSAVILDLCAAQWTDPAETKAYKVPLYIMIGLPVIISIGLFTMLTESPAWLVLKNRLPQAMKSLKWIYPYMTVDELELELAKLQYTVEKETSIRKEQGTASWIECFRGPNLRRTIVAMIPGTAWVQSGNVIFLLTAYFFALAGQTNALQSTVIVQCTGLAFNMISIILVDNKRVGRWTVYMIGLFFQTGGMIMIGAVGAHWLNPGSSALGGNLLVAAVVIANMGCQLGPQAVSYLYMSESGSSRLRAKTTSVAASVPAVLGQISGVYLPFMLASRGCLVAGFTFGGCGVFFLIVSYLVVPDYTGRSHAQIDELYTRRIAARKFASTECTGNYGRDVVHETDSI